MSNDQIVISDWKKHRIELAFRVYWLSPLCSGTIEVGEPLLAWALEGTRLATKSYVDVFDESRKTAYQIKTGLTTSPVTFARVTTDSQAKLVNSNNDFDCEHLGLEVLEWVRNRVSEPKWDYGADYVKFARLIYTKKGEFTYYERLENPNHYDPEGFTWQWSKLGGALEGYKTGQKWFSWYPQGRVTGRNANQLHFHGENTLVPLEGSASRFDFLLGEHAQIEFDDFINVVASLIDLE